MAQKTTGNYCVYMHKTPSGKVYIGQTKQNPPSNRWHEGYKHNKHFRSAIEKYGWENITSIIIASGLDSHEADLLEIALIKKHKSDDPTKGYNYDKGGVRNKTHSEETKRKIGEASKRNWEDPAYREKVISKLKQHKQTEETKNKIRNSRIGKTTSEETRRKISDKLRDYYADNQEARDLLSKKIKESWEAKHKLTM